MNLAPMLIAWMIVGGGTAALALYRKFVSHNEEDIVRLGPGEEVLIPEQMKLARELTAIDKLGKVMTVLTFVFGIVVGLAYLYVGYVNSNVVRFE
jgi:hypothetical protein